MLRGTSTNHPSIAEPAMPGSAPARYWNRITATARQTVMFCSREGLWLACMAAIVLVWTVELYAVQAKTLIYPNEVGARFAFWAPKIRLSLDLLFISVLTIWFRRKWLYAILVAAFFVYLGLVTYFQYFQRPISLLTIFTNWREGLEVGGFALDLFPMRAVLLLAAALAVKLTALFLSRKVELPRDCARLGAAILAVAYVAVYLSVNRWDPLYAIQTKRGVGRLGASRGYLGPWAAEWYYLGDRQVLDRALELRKVKYDRLTPIEADIPVHDRLVILQAESLDFNILGHKIDGVAVTPFLNHLRDISMFYRVRALHFNGSSDADFVAMNAVACSKHENTYMIPGYPYENTTPQLLARCGFVTSSFHGHSGLFYRRRAAFEQMGFDNIFFREELERPPYGLKVDRWGVCDKDLLVLSALKLRDSKSPTCHFIITLTTHTPYTMLPPSEWEIYPNPSSTLEHYMNNMRYLDNCLRDYFTALGSGTTIMLYADHPTEQGSTDGDFTPDRSDGREFIPCFIYDTDRDLSKLQKTRKNPIRRDGNLNLVDMINYLRGQVELEFGDREVEARQHAARARP
jgi:hypothetical protein